MYLQEFGQQNFINDIALFKLAIQGDVTKIGEVQNISENRRQWFYALAVVEGHLSAIHFLKSLE